MSLRCTNVGVSADGKKRLAQVDATLVPGRFTAILKPNGAGKSTLMSLLTGQRQPMGGQVLLRNRPLSAYSAADMATVRAVMLQESAVAFDFLVREVVELGRYPHRYQPTQDEAGLVQQAMEATQVAHLADRNVTTLSGGEKARVQLARALAQVWHPRADGADRWLFLDEPTAALDLAHQHQVMRLLRKWVAREGLSVVAVLHDVNLALRYVDDVLVLDGRLAHFGPTHEVLSAQTLASVWGVSSQAVNSKDGVRQYLFA